MACRSVFILAAIGICLQLAVVDSQRANRDSLREEDGDLYASGGAVISEASRFSKRTLERMRKNLVKSPNRALRRPAVQKSTYGSAVASRATDGDTSTLACTMSEDYAAYDNPWWQVDLGKEYAIDTVIIHRNNNPAFPNRLSNFAVSLSNVPAIIERNGITEDNSPIYHDYKSPCGQYPGKLPDGPTVAVGCPFTAGKARYVTIQVADGVDALCLQEVEVYTRD